MAKIPAFQFYPADWRKDLAVQSLPFLERGIWFEMLCLMHESEERGRLIVNGRPMPDETIARLLGLDKQTFVKAVTVLLESGVATRDESGALINRRMIRDEELRKVRKEAGSKGGKATFAQAKSQANLQANGQQTTEDEDEDKKTRKGIGQDRFSAFDEDVNVLLDAVAPLTGADDRFNLVHAGRWRAVCETVTREKHPIANFLAAVKDDFERLENEPQFFTPEGCLKLLHARKVKPTKKATMTARDFAREAEAQQAQGIQ